MSDNVYEEQKRNCEKDRVHLQYLKNAVLGQAETKMKTLKDFEVECCGAMMIHSEELREVAREWLEEFEKDYDENCRKEREIDQTLLIFREYPNDPWPEVEALIDFIKYFFNIEEE